MKQEDRWHLLSQFFNKEKLKPIHFLHIPKTAGTTFGESLQSDDKAIVISVDAPTDIFLSHIDNAKIKLFTNKKIITRAHHPLNFITNSNAYNCYTLIFSAYRCPIDIHISNVNMIMSRLDSFYKGNCRKEPELSFSKTFANILEKNNITFSMDKETAFRIISSIDYQNLMGNIYYKFLNGCSKEQLNSIKFINYNEFDKLYVEMFKYDNPPKRMNVNSNKLLNKVDLNKQLIDNLTEKDLPIIEKININLISPKELCQFIV